MSGIEIAKMDRRKVDQHRLSKERPCVKSETGNHSIKWSDDFREDDQLFELLIVRTGYCKFCKTKFLEKWIYGTAVRAPE